MVKVAHLTSAHPRYDTRIFIKMCSSLAKQFDVFLVVSDGLGDCRTNDVNIVDVGPRMGGRLSRMTKTVSRVFCKALDLDADIYHLHDPELLPIALKLKKLGKKVIFDSHEDVSKQMIGKPYLNQPLRIFIGWVYRVYERYVCGQIDVIIAATPSIREKFLKTNVNCVDINNFPLLDELANTSDWAIKQDQVAYIGGIAKIRGITQVVRAMGFTNGVALNLAGEFSEQETEKMVKAYGSWAKVNELGFLSRDDVARVLERSKIGLVTFLPLPNHTDSQPNKMFEYMSAGIPIITSDFPLWRDIVEGNECGLCVDPLDPEAIGEAIQYLMDQPALAELMGGNGRRAIEAKYNWPIEEAEVTRLTFDPRGGARITTFKVKLKGAAERGFQLRPLDRVRVSRIPNWSYGDTVEISGSVVFPGEYPIVPGEMLSSVLSRAGGIAENGFPQGAILVKVEAKKREQEQLERLIASIQRNVLGQSQTREQDDRLRGPDTQADLEFLEEVLAKEAGGRVVIDLPALLAGDADADIQLEAGDSLFVPEFNNTISVIGEVRQPGNFRYESDRSIADYLDFAAGTTVRAETKETYVVRANGSVQRVAIKTSLLSFTPAGANGLEPGDTIIVPVNEEYQPTLARYKEVSTVVFQSIASLYPLFRL